MMGFMDKNFLLTTKRAEELFFNYAEKAPIFDFHCHLNPQAIYENERFENLTDAWLGGDHYKWRAMRSCGIPEELITGNAPPEEKLKAYAKTLCWAPGNPLYHWSHLELQRFFGIYEPLEESNSDRIFHQTAEMLQSDDFRVRRLIEKSNVKLIFTTDDPVDDLRWHKLLAKEELSFAVKPAFRPDKALNIDSPAFRDYIHQLSQAAGLEIRTVQNLYDAIATRVDYFDQMGCKASDHAFLEVPFAQASATELDAIFQKAMKGEPITLHEAACHRTTLMRVLAAEYHKRGWVMEIHPGVIRDNNTRQFKQMGPDTGYDSIHDGPIARNLSYLLDSMEQSDILPRTILFAGNENDYGPLATLMGCFQSHEAASKIQLGTSWWFNDTLDGMNRQMRALGNLGVLGKFVGMLTDSRSFLSYPRHEYFRRIFCELLGGWVEQGMFYDNEEQLGRLVRGVCVENAMDYFQQGR